MKFLGIASIVVTWIAISVVILSGNREVSKSISHHAALRSRRYYLFAVLMTISLILMWQFMTSWLIPTLALPTGFTLLVGFTILLELVATWIPLTHDWKRKTHELTSYGAALLVPVVLLYALYSPHVHSLAFVMNTAAILIMIGIFMLFFFVRATHKHHLIYQSLYVAAFHVSLLSFIVSQ